jgi:hypothetical protein
MRAEPEFSETPGLTTIYKWMAENPEFAKDSGRARLLSADTYVDAALNEAHTHRLGTVETERETKDGTFKESKVIDNVERSKLIVQALFKRAGQLDPKKYGDKSAVEHSGEIGVSLAERIAKARKRTG